MNINNDMFNDNDTEILDAELDEEEDDEDEEMEEEEELPTAQIPEGDEMEEDDDEDEEEEEDDDDDDDDDEDDDEEDDENDDVEVEDKEKTNDDDNNNKKADETEIIDDDDNEKTLSKENEDAEKSPKAEEEELITTSNSFKQQLLNNAKNANGFDIVPYVAIPYGSAIHSIALSSGPKWLFTGGEDGFIRKYDFISSIEGNLQLTVAQKHSLVDTMSLAGIITSYWENEQPIYKDELSQNITSSQPNKRGKKKQNEDATVVSSTHYEPKLSPVYSMAVQKEALWLLSGLESGGITLQTVRHNEGSIKHYFKHGNSSRQHNSAVDVLQLNNDNDKFLSGSWDRKILQWDLNNGEVIKEFVNSTSQVSSINYRPQGGVDINPSRYQHHQHQHNTGQNPDDDLDSLFGGGSDVEEEDEDDGSTTLVTMKQEIRKQQTGSTPITEQQLDDNIFMSSSMDGSINVWDLRLQNSNVIRIPVPATTPPWCMSACWSNDGNFIYAGRRNSIVEEISIKMPFDNHYGKTLVSKTLKFPSISGPVSVVKPMMNNNHLLCGSFDNIRLYDLRLYDDMKLNPKKAKIPFMIVPGHHGGVLSDLYVDPTCRFMVGASGNRGWNGSSTEMVLIYEINVEK